MKSGLKVEREMGPCRLAWQANGFRHIRQYISNIEVLASISLVFSLHPPASCRFLEAHNSSQGKDSTCQWNFARIQNSGKLISGHRTTEVVTEHYFHPYQTQVRQALESAIPKLLTNGQKTLKDQMLAILDRTTAKTWKKDAAQLRQLAAAL